MRFCNAIVLLLLLLSGCGFSPAASEGDDGVGSNTNWFRACESDVECGLDLACVCGSCTKECSSNSDCGQAPEGKCPVDRGAFAAACGVQAALDAQRNICFQACEDSSQCPASGVCVGGGCVRVDMDPCAEAEAIELERSSPELRARKGGLFADEFYVPEWFAGHPQGWVEPYRPSTLTARVTNQDGEPVSGCEVRFFTTENSGHGFANEPYSNESGEVSALWVAGSARYQTISAAVRARNGWLFASTEGEARGHDEEPQAQGPSARNYTAPSGVGVRPSVEIVSLETQLTFVPVTFPAQVTYSVIDTGHIALGFTNNGSHDPAQGALDPSERLLQLRLFDQGGQRGGVVAVRADSLCRQDGFGFRCLFPDAWQAGESIEMRLFARHVAEGEVPSDYNPETHSSEPCYSSVGCTDFTVLMRRSGQTEFAQQAILRSMGMDDLSARTAYISGVYSLEIGIASSCLETERASFWMRQETLVDGSWVGIRGGSMYASHDTWQNQTCANYAVFETNDGYYLSTGGTSPISTPTLPGVERDL
jgi:hypothetical protein